MYFDPTYMFLVLIPTLALTIFAQWRVRAAFKKWSRVPNEKGLTGYQTAEIIMRETGLTDVTIGHVDGQLTDHYDPRTNEMRLSDSATKPTVAGMAIVAHELGHAEQDVVGSKLLGVRSALVPAANIGSRLGVLLIIAGLFLRLTGLSWIGVFLFAGAVAFTLVTLPVEFDASRRAKRHISELALASPREQAGVEQVLNAAALTYVAAAAAAVLNLLYYVSLIQRRR